MSQTPVNKKWDKAIKGLTKNKGVMYFENYL